jgi:hypothetical protein
MASVAATEARGSKRFAVEVASSAAPPKAVRFAPAKHEQYMKSGFSDCSILPA